MSEWVQVRLGDVATSFAGGTPSRDNDAFFGGSIPWIKSTEVNRDYVDHTEEYLTELGLQCSAAKLIKSGAVLIALYGATAGEVAMLRINATANQAVLAISPVDTEVDSEFLYYSLSNEKQQILFKAQGSGQPNLSKSLIDSLRLLIPPLPQQKKIARILTTVDNLIEKTEALIEKYKSIKQGMMHDLFTRGVDQNGKLRPPYEEAPHLYKESPLGWIPKEWKATTLENSTERVVVGLALSVTHAYREKGVPLIRNQNIRRGYFEDDEMLYLDPRFAKLFPNKAVNKDDVLTVRTGSNVGDTSLVPDKYIGSPTFTTLITSTKKEVLHPQYLVHYVDSNYGSSELNRLLVGGGKENLNVGEFIKMRLILPPLREQNFAVKSLLGLNLQVANEQRMVRKLKTLKTGLMQDLLTGKVRVKLDITEEILANG